MTKVGLVLDLGVGAAVDVEVLGEHPRGRRHHSAGVGRAAAWPRQLGEEAVPPLALAQRLLGPLAVGDVAGDLRRADDAPVGVPERARRSARCRAGGRPWRRAPSRSARSARPRAAGARMAGSSSSRSGGMIRVMRLADGLLGGVAEEPLGPGVPGPDDAVEGLADDGVVGRLDDRRQPRLGLLRPPPLGHVAEDQDRPDGGPGAVPHRGGRCRRSAARSRPGRSGRVWLARPTTRPSRRARRAGFSTGWRVVLVDDAEDVGQRPAGGLGLAASRSGPRPRRSGTSPAPRRRC